MIDAVWRVTVLGHPRVPDGVVGRVQIRQVPIGLGATVDVAGDVVHADLFLLRLTGYEHSPWRCARLLLLICE